MKGARKKTKALFSFYGYCTTYKLEKVMLKKIKSLLYHISMRDKCVVQNKSNVTKKYACFQSLIFYQRAIIIFLLPGHSHMAADIAITHAKTPLKLKNLFHRSDSVNVISTAKRISSKFINH